MNSQDIILAPEEFAELSRQVRSVTIHQRDGSRARVILLAAQCCLRIEIARLVRFSLRSVTRAVQTSQDVENPPRYQQMLWPVWSSKWLNRPLDNFAGVAEAWREPQVLHRPVSSVYGLR